MTKVEYQGGPHPQADSNALQVCRSPTPLAEQWQENKIVQGHQDDNGNRVKAGQ